MVQDKINEIGERLLHCPLQCVGVLNDQQAGIIPRGIIYEHRTLDPGHVNKRCLIIGLNPGATDVPQKQAYLAMHPLTFEGVTRTIFQLMPQWPYYLQLRMLVTSLLYDGDICWANMVNCECATGFDFVHVPAQTKRVCIKRFLNYVVDLFPFTTIFAVGRITYDFCAFCYPDHLVVGVPHPSRKPNFQPLIDQLQPRLPQIMTEISQVEDGNGNARAVWLADFLVGATNQQLED